MKSRHKRRAFWTIITTLATIVVAIIVAPNFINLNSLRPHLEDAIFKQTGVDVKIEGDINFGLVGRPTIVAHGVRTPNGFTKALAVKIPFSGLFDITNTKLDGAITAYGANINIKSLEALKLAYYLDVNDSVLKFKGHDYNIINGIFKNGTFDGLVRTGQHKYDIRFSDDNKFTIKNKNMNLEINGEFYPSGAASGTLEIATDKINSWFEFDEPKITSHVNLTMDFWWDGENGFKFYDLVANNVRGDIELEPNGWHTINLYSDDTNFDFSFLSRPTKILRDTRLNIDFRGNLTFKNQMFNHVKIDTLGTENYIQINHILADNTSFTGGTIDNRGGHDIMVKTEFDGKNTECLFSGTPEIWECRKFTYGDITGKIKFDKRTLNAEVASNRNVSLDELESYINRLGARTATVKFKFANIGGQYIKTSNDTKVDYDYVYGQTLRWLNPHAKILPDFIMDAPGNIVWTNDTITFIPNSNEWSLTLHDNFFYLTGTSIQQWFPNTDMRSIRDFDYVASGFYNDCGDISDLTVKIADHVFTGTSNSTGITLHTDTLVLDSFISADFSNRYEEMEYITNPPILIPFDFEKNIYLTADKLVWGTNAYSNFVYAVKSGTMTMSITDSARGNMLATIISERSEYDIFVQLNRFVINGDLLKQDFPLNVMNTTITAEMSLHTSGHVAHDIRYNMAGDMDFTFDGGYISGIGLDDFYANAENITRLNVEDMLMTALESGITKIKSMRVIGRYENGVFNTTTPMQISMRHADAIGAMTLERNAMTAKLDISMRAAAPDPVTVSVSIAPNGRRGYSLSEIMRYFDPAFMRSFIRTHDKF
ncbi:MAG: hypothetical protein J6T57_01875 [Alphaproteobacteria bacterium]|nr:hypothetical protein [Alphaproteobacteria bacterium]